MAEPLTVTQLNTRVRALLSSTPDVRDIWVSGEISNLTRASSGHYYFVLKDATGEVRCALFARARSRPACSTPICASACRRVATALLRCAFA